MNEKFRQNKLSFLVVLLSILVVSFGKIRHVSDNPVPRSIAWDVYGYYLYLPATFIYHDPGLKDMTWVQNTVKKYPPSPTLYQFTDGIDGKHVDIYSMGLAGCYAPGFLMAHLYTKISSGYPSDGFSAPYQWSLVFTGIFFACLGIILLRKILLRFFSDRLSAFLILVIVFGTNYWFHAGFDGIMPHNYMFVLNCLILLFTFRWHETFNIRYAILLGLSLGWATVSRPTEIIWLLVPVLWGVKDKSSFREKMKLLRMHRSHLAVFASAVIVTGLPQLIYWKWTSGQWLSFNHTEGFSFLAPYTPEFLFSFKKGWLIYTPIMIFGILGFYQLYRSRRELFVPLFTFFLVNVYVLSSWENWWYASSFGQRPMIESYPLMAIPMGTFILSVWNRGALFRLGLSSIIVFFLWLNIFQTWQMLVGIMDGERMTMAYYWKIFGKMDVPVTDRELLEIDRGATDDDKFTDNPDKYYRKEIFNLDLESNSGNVDRKQIVDTLGCQSKHCLKLDSLYNFSPGVSSRYFDITDKPYMWVRASVDVYPTTAFSISNSCVVVAIDSKGRLIKYKARGLSNAMAKRYQWNKLIIEYLTPYIRHRSDKLKVYYWNMGKAPVYIDNLKVEVLEPKTVPY